MINKKNLKPKPAGRTPAKGGRVKPAGGTRKKPAFERGYAS